MQSKPKRMLALALISIFMFFTFLTAISQPAYGKSELWWDTDWSYRMKLTFDNSASAENLIDFPVMVNLSRAGSDFWSHVDPDHEDLRFIDDDSTTELYFEIEYWNHGDQEASVWVEVPQIDTGSTTDFIYMYYGNSEASESAFHNPTEVWNSNFVMVQHLEETSGAVTDSISSGNDGTYTGSGQSALGKIDGGDDFDGNDYTTVADDATLNFGTTSFSYSFWFYSRAIGTQYMLAKKTGTLGGTSLGYMVGISSTDSVGFSASLGDGTDKVRIDTGAHPARGGKVWAMFAVVVDRTQQKMFVYIDGAEIASSSINLVDSTSNSQNLVLGKQVDAGSAYFNGVLDEVCISNVARTPDWVEASYLSTSGNFITYGVEEESGKLILTVTSPQSTTYYTATATVPLEGTTNLDSDITYSLDEQDNVTVGSNTQSFSTSLTGLTYSTHSITVYAEETADPSNTASTTIDFTVQKPPSWACPDCKYRMKLTFNNAFSSEAHSNFPVLVVLNPSRIDYSKTSATDIRFYDGDTLLPKETELWNEAGNSYIWVKIPQIDNTDTDYIYAYYDCSGTPNEDDAASVWDPYVMVHHLEETSGTVTDSTSYGNDGTYNGTTQGISGKINGAYGFECFPNPTPPPDYLGGNYIAAPHSTSLNLGTSDFTISVWIKYGEDNGDADILRKGNTGDTIRNNYKLELSSNNIAGNLYDGSDSRVETTTSYGDNNWHYVVFLRESATIYLYIDGILKDSEGSAGRNVDNTSTMGIGSKNSYNDDFYTGVIDEVSIIKTARSADWIKASYNSMNDNFITYGYEETPATIESCNSGGTKKDTFNIGETVYVFGSGYAPSTSYPLYVVDDVETWSDGMTIPTRVSGTETSVSSDSDGNIPSTAAWSSASLGEYDIVVDFNNNGVYDHGIDALDDLDVSTAGFFVIPEYAVGTILALAMCFGGVAVYRKLRHRRLRTL